jgi:putative DNA primase/helicase
MIPRELQDYKQWVCWVRPQRTTTKLPISPIECKPASCTDPGTWGSYQQARATAARFRLEGIGFVFTAADPYAGVDLDHCRAIGGHLEPRAAETVQRLNSYTECSPSGEGLHILVKASLPESSGRRTSGIEIYSSQRYFTITGDHLEGTPNTIEDRQAEILDLVAALDRRTRSCPPCKPSSCIAQSDEELIRRAQRAKNGAKFQRLWAGDTSDYDGDHSRADAALCSLLAYYADGDSARIDRLFRASGLYRQKWDRPTAGSTYGSITIQAVIGGIYREHSSA